MTAWDDRPLDPLTHPPGAVRITQGIAVRFTIRRCRGWHGMFRTLAGAVRIQDGDTHPVFQTALPVRPSAAILIV
jgi:hypothetical protein